MKQSGLIQAWTSEYIGLYLAQQQDAMRMIFLTTFWIMRMTTVAIIGTLSQYSSLYSGSSPAPVQSAKPQNTTTTPFERKMKLLLKTTRILPK